MLFKRTKRENSNVNFENGRGDISITKGSEIEKQITMIGLTEKDLHIINAIQPFVIENINFIVDRFYKNLENELSLLKIINDHSSIEKLKKTLRQHIMEMFNGRVDASFIDKRIKIAHMHVKIGLPTKWYMCAFQDLFLALMDIIQQNIINKEDCFLAIRAVSKILNLEQQLVLEAYAAESERLKEAVEEQKQLVRNNVASASQNLAAISEQTNASFQQLISQSNEIVSLAKNGTKLSLSAQERAEKGKEHMHKQALIMSNIYSAVDDISNDVHILLEISNQMQEIVGIVTGIADQTNLLSLNATIEAARAGESGRGFAVVAGEVRNLSEQTKNSVSKVSSLIQNTQKQVEKLTKSLDKIRTEVKNGNQNMQETEKRFEQILDTMAETMQQNNKIETELISFVNVIDELGKAFEEVSLSADKLTMITQELN
ncbi:globin-coupled sensor protein [Parageobacillus thermoglucosidasius]|uniref:Methyl-accepting chemotaxis sensory transducer n=1 Tax=Geobacillus sp. (strain Y4.1MC1) TaxID=581103 RepID=A0A7U3YF65_GEOS0|nr:globin-coupled sensor protein [Parageobacillus thermoglucosidasius]AEH47902.1 methyl-accepting chemotaxis sensory transducer [Parageobacillus thermoglucosidasius C56-YS93]MED4906557.1 globin-coupled sensor protein [Parageobacillus thermoglucosidasius]MED4915513.1 globin-coupled sensor protein [Parageobacillus thermoglucosidasius]MED4946675.1 globin-coupled sensor protein [Parageobacillus thermoglucosidasius]MED4984848.1 globin-coupled sensor protein [Parageobacillus thermoglucosidasius]